MAFIQNGGLSDDISNGILALRPRGNDDAARIMVAERCYISLRIVFMNLILHIQH